MLKANDVCPIDTTHLHEVSITAEVKRIELIPVQKLSGAELQNLNSFNVADVMRHFSGIQVKDYGGVGGIKTINVRSMGTNHTAVVFDGVELGNAQNGQIDLGQFSLDNIEEISLYNGQKSNLLQPAKDFASAASVYLRSRRPVFVGTKKFNFRGTIKAGSFDLLNALAVADFKLNNSVSATVSLEGLTSSGKYKFRVRKVSPDGSMAYDTTAIRQNGDINAVRAEVGFYGTLPVGSWSAKAYNYTSERGIPGAIVNNVWYRGERQSDCNSFVQGSWQGDWDNFSSMCNVKYAYYATHYLNKDPRYMKIDNRYRHHEAYFSTSNRFQILPQWAASVNYDLQYNQLWSDMYEFAMPRRWSNYLSVASSLDLRKVNFMASATGIWVHDINRRKRISNNSFAFTPAVFINTFPLPNSNDFSLRAFVKQSYRMPTFNDLYYTDIGTTTLRPERVTQYNVGALYQRSDNNSLLAEIRFSLDAYFNKVTDKIVAYPKGQLFRWTMLNLGKVNITGIDASGLLTFNPVDDLMLTLRGQYTWQRAIDVTNPASSYYRHQIPYIPLHSGSAAFNASFHGWALNLSYICVGSRYSKQENIKYNYLAPWQTTDLSLSHDFVFAKFGLRAMIEVNNLFNETYSVIVNYPMPGRNFRVTLSINL